MNSLLSSIYPQRQRVRRWLVAVASVAITMLLYTLSATIAPARAQSGNVPPDAGDDEYDVVEDTGGILDPLSNDSDADGDSLRVITATSPVHGALSYDGTWQFMPVESGESSFWYISLAAIGGRPALAYFDHAHTSLKYAHYDGSGWQTGTVDNEGYAGAFASLTEVNGQPAISYTYWDGVNSGIKYARYNGSAWQITTIESHAGMGTSSPSLAVVDGQPAISYRDGLHADLKYARYDGVTWQIETVDSAGDVGFDTSLALIDDQPAISYFDMTNYDLKYARFDGAAWQTTTVDSEGVVGVDNSLAEVQGQPAISYRLLERDDLKYARYDGTAWQTTTVDSVGDIYGSSLAVVDGQPAIAYHVGFPSYDLRYARYEGAAWQITAVDSDGNVGHDASLDIIEGAPAIGYFDSSNLTLKYARYNFSGGRIHYDPHPDYCGADSFSYHAFDGIAHSNVATVSLAVACTPDAPVADEDRYQTAMETPLIVDAPGVLTSDSDPDGDTLTAHLADPPFTGTLSLDPDGGFTYAPPSGYSGEVYFRYYASDGTLQSDPTTVTVLVEGFPTALSLATFQRVGPRFEFPWLELAFLLTSIFLGYSWQKHREG